MSPQARAEGSSLIVVSSNRHAGARISMRKPRFDSYALVEDPINDRSSYEHDRDKVITTKHTTSHNQRIAVYGPGHSSSSIPRSFTLLRGRTNFSSVRLVPFAVVPARDRTPRRESAAILNERIIRETITEGYLKPTVGV